MPITLADAQQNSATDVDYNVIDEFRKSDWVMDNVTFDDAVTPGTGGATLTYGYTRVVTERAAAPRNFNGETDFTLKATRAPQTTELVPLSAGFEVDRSLAHLGQRTSDEVTFQMQQAIKGVRALWSQSLIDGAANTDNTYEGLDSALAGSSTEVNGGVEGTDVLTVTDWTSATITDEASGHTAIDALDNLLSLLDGEPTAILTNRQGKLRLRAIARRAGYYSREKDDFGRQVESYAGIPFVDLGARSGSSNPVIPVESRDIDGGGAGANETNLTDFYVVRLGLDGLHGVSTVGSPLLQTWLPDFSTAKAVKQGEVEMGPVSLALKATKAAAVLRNVKIAA